MIEISLPDGSRVRVGNDVNLTALASCHDGAARMIAPPPACVCGWRRA